MRYSKYDESTQLLSNNLCLFEVFVQIKFLLLRSAVMDFKNTLSKTLLKSEKETIMNMHYYLNHIKAAIFLTVGPRYLQTVLGFVAI